MTKYQKLFLATVLSLTGFSARAEVNQEIDMRVQKRIQNTKYGGASAVPTEYGEIPNGFILGLYRVEYDTSNYTFDFEATNIGLNNQSIKAEGGQPGRMTWGAGYDKMPHLFSNEARSPYVYVGDGTMRLDGAWRNIGLTGNFNNAVSSALANTPYVPLGFDVETANAELRFHPAQDFTVELGTQRQTKRGTRSQSVSFGFSNAIELAAPIDWEANEAFLEMQLNKKAYQLAASYRLSDFNNKIPNLFWDNPKRLTDNYVNNNQYSAGDSAAKGALANAPDNRAHALKFEGGVALPMSSRFSFEAGYQQWTANNQMLPYTTNIMIGPGNPNAVVKPTFDAWDPNNRPSATVDGLIEVYTYMFKLTSHPLSWLKGTLTHDSYIMDNKSTQYTVPGWAQFDEVWHAETATTPREQFREDKTSLKLDYDITSWLSGDLGLSRKYEKKTREISKGQEFEAGTGFQVRPSKDLFVNLSFLMSARRGNGISLYNYPTVVSPTSGRTYFTEAPGLRRIDVADRNRTVARAQMQWTPGDASLSLSARVSEDKYRLGKGDPTGGDIFVYNEQYGVTSDINKSIGLDFTLPAIGGVEVDGYYTYDVGTRYLKSSQTAGVGSVYGIPGEAADTTAVMTGDPRSRWENRMKDQSHIAGVSMTVRPTAKLKAMLGYDLVSSLQNYDTMYAGSLASTAADPYLSFPTSKRMTQTVKVRGDYKLTENLTVAANYIYEKFDANDFGFGNVPLRDGANSVIYLGVNPIRNYYAHTIGTGVNYKF